MLQEVVDTGEVDKSGQRQRHWRPVHDDWVGSSKQSEQKKRKEERCKGHGKVQTEKQQQQLENSRW